jgi:hypothetical protein
MTSFLFSSFPVFFLSSLRHSISFFISSTYSFNLFPSLRNHIFTPYFLSLLLASFPTFQTSFLTVPVPGQSGTNQQILPCQSRLKRRTSQNSVHLFIPDHYNSLKKYLEHFLSSFFPIGALLILLYSSSSCVRRYKTTHVHLPQ